MSAVTDALTGIAVSWPPAGAGMALTWYLARRSVRNSVRQATEFQTADIAAIANSVTDSQTADLMRAWPAADPDGQSVLKA